MWLGDTTATHTRVVQWSAKNKANPQAQGQDTQGAQTEQQQELGTSKLSSSKEPQKARGKKPKKGSQDKTTAKQDKKANGKS
ncbi:hypothetical protein NHP22001_15360 [Helicobacter sp. NHP22-001]|nr:hypothetical protein NHP22001_15360 [Helicobacter sp. NHP22-001]